jgi:hypothetical protein
VTAGAAVDQQVPPLQFGNTGNLQTAPTGETPRQARRAGQWISRR